MKVLVINNLASGINDGMVFDFVRSLMTDGDEVVVRSTDGQTDLRAFLYDAQDFDFVVASGGDGTVGAVAYALADTAIPLLPFPAGTSNLLAANIMSPNEPHALVKVARTGHTMDFDLGEILLPDGQKFGFTLMAGAGWDATIMREAQAGKKYLGPVAYFTSAFANAMPPVATFTLNIDGRVHVAKGVGVLIINFSKIQFDLSIVHENRPRDGVFDVVVLSTKDAFGLIPALFAAILDAGGDFPGRTDAFEIYTGSSITIDADPPLCMQYDGEVTDLTTPFEVRLLPAAARYIVSDECMKAYGNE